ncbi:MAG TPA: HNH endonuclease signature motif containing protein [Gemmatimonadaceae bacterium]|nr:HNH endonuclease signature motif containing protein [Gemmatimonadaceae bacterium]
MTERRKPAAKQSRPAKAASKSVAKGGGAAKAPAKKRSRRSRKPYRGTPTESQHTSLPTSRNAYTETRDWLLAQHGPICAYCERKVSPRAITLDHVTPRRGQTAYDRRDNLVLSCSACNAAKADKPFLAFLLGNRERAENLLHYGTHLSPMLIDLARQIAGPDAIARAERDRLDPDYPYRD